MDASILLARIIGPLFVVIAVGVLINRDVYRDMIEDFVKSPSLIYFSGAMALAIGIAIVLFHNIWVLDWRVILTLLGWGLILKGSMRILFPGWIVKVIADNWLEGSTMLASLIFTLAIGVWLSVMGYWVGG